MALGARSHTYVLALQTRVIQSVAEEGFSGSESIAVGEDLMIHQRPIKDNHNAERKPECFRRPVTYLKFPSSVASKVVVTLRSRFVLYGH